ncbi:MAG: hypothetical protein PHW76_04005, partial [Alphaproteobacteria bacterium]|nr:hypothetical protein [Alphaproteobacteria bacterium]
MLSKEHIDGLNNAFNEARLLGAEIDVERRIVALTIAGICMNSDGTIPEDRRVQIILEPIGKFLASFRNSRWDDDGAKAVPLLQNELLTVAYYPTLRCIDLKRYFCGTNKERRRRFK